MGLFLELTNERGKTKPSGGAAGRWRQVNEQPRARTSNTISRAGCISNLEEYEVREMTQQVG